VPNSFLSGLIVSQYQLVTQTLLAFGSWFPAKS
jgi:hypothetical protein